jgi:hypothetical protein
MAERQQKDKGAQGTRLTLFSKIRTAHLCQSILWALSSKNTFTGTNTAPVHEIAGSRTGQSLQLLLYVYIALFEQTALSHGSDIPLF